MGERAKPAAVQQLAFSRIERLKDLGHTLRAITQANARTPQRLSQIHQRFRERFGSPACVAEDITSVRRIPEFEEQLSLVEVLAACELSQLLSSGYGLEEIAERFGAAEEHLVEVVEGLIGWS